MRDNESIDITGNWRTDDLPSTSVRTREPFVPAGQTVTFTQTLRLPRGQVCIELEYLPAHDDPRGHAIGGAFEKFAGLRADGEVVPMEFRRVEDGGKPDWMTGERWIARSAPIQVADRPLGLSLTLCHSRALCTRLVGAPAAATSPFRALAPAGGQGQSLLVRGVPFLLRQLTFFECFIDTGHFGRDLNLDRGNLNYPWGGGMELPCCGAAVARAHFLGMLHNLDIANGSWYARHGDNGYAHFVGDQAGEIVIGWTGGGESVVPLVFGYNLWYARPWDAIWHMRMWGHIAAPANRDDRLFPRRDEVRDAIADSLTIIDGLRAMGSRSNCARYLFTLDLQGRRVESIAIRGQEGLYDHPLISAVTLETASPCAELPALPALAADAPPTRPVGLEEIARGDWRQRVERVKRHLYTYVRDLPDLKEPQVPRGYFGPHYDFRGTREAVCAATYLYYNGPECAAHIADSGTGCQSSTARFCTLPHYYLSWGGWMKEPAQFDGIEDWLVKYQSRSPGELPGIGNVWTRGAGELLREAMALGYGKFVDSFIDWLDDCLFKDATPPHWVRVAGTPQLAGTPRKIGDIEETGNRENDGHGICMWGRYMIWHWLGRPREWNERRFAATQAAVEWIQWQLDTDTIYPGARKDILFTDSECAHGDYDIYSSFNPLHGLKLSIRMAAQLGRADLVAKWTALYERLRRGILEHLVDDTPQGPVWHTEPVTDWQDHAHKLVPLQLATDGDTYTPLQDYAAGDELDRRYLEICQSTYRALMKPGDYNYVRMYGYGQGMMTQAALLLDQMADATGLIDMMVTHGYLPHMEGWIGPEGIVVHPGGEYYVAVNGYSGQDSHVADSVKALRVIMGIDDNDPMHLRLVPRYPAAWTSMSVRDIPVLTGETGTDSDLADKIRLSPCFSARQLLSYRYERHDRGQTFHYELQRSAPRISVRLGPIPDQVRVASATHAGRAVPFECVDSGDSRWVWLRDLAGQEGTIALTWA